MVFSFLKVTELLTPDVTDWLKEYVNLLPLKKLAFTLRLPVPVILKVHMRLSVVLGEEGIRVFVWIVGAVSVIVLVVLFGGLISLLESVAFIVQFHTSLFFCGVI